MSEPLHFHNLVIMYSNAADGLEAAKKALQRSCLVSAPIKQPRGTAVEKLSATLTSFDSELCGSDPYTRRLSPTGVVKPAAVLFVRVDSTVDKLRKPTIAESTFAWRTQYTGTKIFHTFLKAGYGFHRSVNDDGFDEVYARNETLRLAVELANQKGCVANYTTFIDADEFLLLDDFSRSIIATTSKADIVAYKTQQVISIPEIDKLVRLCDRCWLTGLSGSATPSERLYHVMHNCTADKDFIELPDGSRQPRMSARETVSWLLKLRAIAELQFTVVSQITRRSELKALQKLLLVPDTTGVHPRTISNELLRSGRVRWKHNPKTALEVNTTKHCILSVTGAPKIVTGADNYLGLHGHHRSLHDYLPSDRVLDFVQSRLFSKDVRQLLSDSDVSLQSFSLSDLVARTPKAIKQLQRSALGYLAISR